MIGESIFPLERAFGLAFDVERDSERRSGFKPAEIQLGPQMPLPMYGELRLHGFAATIMGGFCEHITIVGKDEKRINDCVVYQGNAICEMLVRDLGVPREQVSWNTSDSNTGHTLEVIRKMVYEDREAGKHRRCAIITSHYHRDRSEESALCSGWSPVFLSAESFILAACASEVERSTKRNWIEEELRRYDYVARAIAEINGISDMRRGVYQPQTRGW
ncbi:MAG TPA: hypothetical protein VMU13_00595 [Candidatus Paceibacterota bacterium]|nr:hypothetical protein [Candidatus Paceibacterota bacterium]